MMSNKNFIGVVLLVLTMAFYPEEIPAQQAGSKSALLNVKTNDAAGDGITDDTEAIQKTIHEAASGDTVYIPEGKYLVSTLKLKSGVHIKGEGLLVQKIPDKAEEFTPSRQNSSAPLFRGNNIADVYLAVRAQAKNEAVYLSGSKNITIANSFLEGDATKVKSFAGILLYYCENVRIKDSSISHFGAPRKRPDIYQPGTAIRILSSRDVRVTKNRIFKNGENGVFTHSTPDVEVSNNHIYNNGMSAIQVAFGTGGIEKNYQFRGNIMEGNAADAIDINNRSLEKYLDINCLIEDNTSRNNGFVRGKSTPDGSGIATLINVSGVNLRNNIAEGNNRPALYIESCDLIQASGNKADNQLEVVLDFGELVLVENTFTKLSLLSNVNGKKLRLTGNILVSLSLPNGIKVDSLIMKQNTISNASLNFNMKGNVQLLGNTISSHEKDPPILIVRAGSVHLEKNRIISTRSHAVSVRKMATRVSLLDNVIRSVNACIIDEGSKSLKVIGNKLYSLEGGRYRHTLVSQNPDGLVLSKNEHTSTGKNVALRLEGRGEASVSRENIIEGTADYGAVKVEKIR